MARFILDIETNGLLAELTRVHSLVLRDIDTGLIAASACHEREGSLRIALEMAEAADLLVGHNIIKFDSPAIQKVYPGFRYPQEKVRDTLVLARLVWPDLLDLDLKLIKQKRLPGNLLRAHSLKAWGHRLGCFKGEYDGGWESWSPAMQDYCEQDTEVTLALWRRIETMAPSDESVSLEHEVAWIIARQERYGVGFDRDAAVALYATLVERREQLKDELRTLFPAWEVRTPFTPKANNKTRGYVKGVPTEKVQVIHFNPASRDHVANRLIAVRGWEPLEFGKDGKPTVDDEVLAALPWPESKALAEFFMVQKRIGQLAEGQKAWLKKVTPEGRIHGSVNTNGAVTGRMTHADPNLAQVPANGAPYGKQCRALFRARKGKRLVGCDADALELRCLAGYMARYDGGAYIETILKGRKEDGTDMHSVNARLLEVLRDVAKTFFYAFIYGAGDWKLGATAGATGERGKVSNWGKTLRARLLNGLPALGLIDAIVKATIKKAGTITMVQGRKIIGKGALRGLDGRVLPIRGEHAALNTLLQSAGAVFMKKALVIADKALQAAGYVPGINYEFVLNIHDEWQVEADEAIATSVGEILKGAIAEAGRYFNFACPLAGNFDIGGTWADTH